MTWGILAVAIESWQKLSCVNDGQDLDAVELDAFRGSFDVVGPLGDTLSPKSPSCGRGPHDM